MTEPGLALQKAMVGALAGDSSIQTLVGSPARIYDDAPRNTAFPYVTIGASTIADWDTSTERGHEHAFMFHIWSRHGGYKEGRAIIGAIESVLHNATLTLEDHALINLRFEFGDVFRDGDGETVHAVMRYRAVTEPLP